MVPKAIIYLLSTGMIYGAGIGYEGTVSETLALLVRPPNAGKGG